MNQKLDWILFTFEDKGGREIFSSILPSDEEEILVSDGHFVWIDTFIGDNKGICYLDSNTDFEGLAWMPLPAPYRKEEEE